LVAFPVYETISNPAVADSFQHQATLFTPLAFEPALVPNVKPSLLNEVTTCASLVFSALLISE